MTATALIWGAAGDIGRALAHRLKADGWQIIAAVSERMRLPGLSAYAAAKAGLEAFAEALRKEERQRRVLVVRPGAVRTKFWQKVPRRCRSSCRATPWRPSNWQKRSS